MPGSNSKAHMGSRREGKRRSQSKSRSRSRSRSYDEDADEGGYGRRRHRHHHRGEKEEGSTDNAKRRRSRSPREARSRRHEAGREGERGDRGRGGERDGNRDRDRKRDRHRDRDRDRERDRGGDRDRDRDGDRDGDRDRDRDRHSKHRSRRHHRSRSRDRDRDRDRASPSTQPPQKRITAPLPSQEAAFSISRGGGGGGGDKSLAPPPEKKLPNFAPTGLLAAETKTVQVAADDAGGRSVVLKYHEPPEARKPGARQAEAMRLFVFKNGSIVDTIELGKRSCWLIGRDVAVCDLAAEHPSVSGQHAVIQFRYVEKVDEFGERKGAVRPYVLDLESANGTVLNGERVEGGRFVEIRDGDLLGFGESTREYVVLLPKVVGGSE